MLTEEQLSSYAENGFLVVPDVFDADALRHLNSVTDDFVKGSCAVQVSNDLYDLAPEHSADNPMVRRIKDPQLQDDVYRSASRHEPLVDIVEDLLGHGVRFDHGKLNIKPPMGSAAIEWHQDWAFYPHTNDDMLAVGILLEDCGPENGPLMVIPGSHRGPTYDHHHEGYFAGACKRTDMGHLTADAVALTGKAGSCTFHHVRALHASTRNSGPRERRLLLYSYMAVDAWPLIPVFDIEAFDEQILRGVPTREPRQVEVPVRLPLPRREGTDGIFDDQAVIIDQQMVG